MDIIEGINGKARRIRRAYIGVNGVARRVYRAYIGVNGIARPCHFVPRTLTLLPSPDKTHIIKVINGESRFGRDSDYEVTNDGGYTFRELGWRTASSYLYTWLQHPEYTDGVYFVRNMGYNINTPLPDAISSPTPPRLNRRVTCAAPHREVLRCA